MPCWPSLGPRSRHKADDAAQEPAAQQTVAVATAQSGSIDNQLTVAGIFQPFQEVDVHGKVSGYIRHIYVDIGDRVRQGQTLAVLEVPELQAEVAGAKAGVSQTQQSSPAMNAQAQTQRPDLQSLKLNEQAYQRFARAQALQHLPTISALATGGETPIGPDGVSYHIGTLLAQSTSPYHSLPDFTSTRRRKKLVYALKPQRSRHRSFPIASRVTFASAS